MQFTVPTLSILFMVIVAAAGVAIPIIMFFVFRKKFKADILPFFIGCAVFVVFALLIEGSINVFIFSTNAGKAIQGNIWYYGIFGGLMAGIFEETGRFTAFKTVLKKRLDNDGNALMYGAGHGGFEAFYILVFSMVSYITMAVMLNNGMIDKLTAGITDPVTLQILYAKFAGLSTTAPPVFLMAIVERIAAVALHLSCSVLVWFAAKKGGKLLLFYPLAILIHALIDAVAVILANYTGNVWIVESAVYVVAACSVVIAIAVWKKYASQKAAAAEIKTSSEAVS